MCKFTYLGYAGCDEPERHYLIRREKCTAKAHVKHWCGPNEQEECTAADEDSRLNLECPMCADVPVFYDQPLLEISHSRRPGLTAPHYDAVTGKYSRLPRQRVPFNHSNGSNTVVNTYATAEQPPRNLVPKPLNPARVQYDVRSASESAVGRIKQREVSPEYKLPAATYMPSHEETIALPAVAYMSPPGNTKLPQPLPVPQPAELTPPSSRDASLSPPQSRMGTTMRTIPPGESNRRELESIRERHRAATMGKSSRPSTPLSRAGTDRSRSGSESSGSSSKTPPPPPPPRMPSRKPSTASSEASAGSSAPSASGSGSGSVSSRTGQRRPQHYRKDSIATSASGSTSTSRSPPQESGTESFRAAALRSIGIDRTASPERGRRPYRRDRGGSSSERSDSPSVWRPTISPPRLQQDSLGMVNGDTFKRLSPYAPSKSATSTPNGFSSTRGPGPGPAGDPIRAGTPQPRDNGDGDGARQATVLRLYPSRSDDDKVAQAAFNTMFHEEQRALFASLREPTPARQQPQQQKRVNFQVVAPHPDEETLTEVDMQTVSQITRGGGDPYHVAGVGRGTDQKALPSVPTGLRRIKTGQVKTVNVAPPRPPKRANTADSVAIAASSSVAGPGGLRVKGGPLFSVAGVGGKAREFEIVAGAQGNALGQAF